MKPRFVATVIVIILLFFSSWYFYAKSLPPIYQDWDDLIHLETNKETYRQGETVRVSVYLANPYFRTVKYPHFTSFGIDANYDGDFNEALPSGVHITPASEYYTLGPLGRDYIYRNEGFQVGKSGIFYIKFQLYGHGTLTREIVVKVN